MKGTKPVRKIETPRQLLANVVCPEGSRIMDLDGFVETNEGWVILEYIWCKTCPPLESHPRRTWRLSWRKYVRLWRLAHDLKSLLFVVHFEFLGLPGGAPRSRFAGGFRVIEAKTCGPCAIPSEHQPFTTEEVLSGNLDDYSRWYRALEESIRDVSEVPQPQDRQGPRHGA